MEDMVVLSLILGTIIALIFGAILYLHTKINDGDATHTATEEEPRQQAPVVPRGNRAAANKNARNRLRAVLAQRRGEDVSEEEEDDIAPLPQPQQLHQQDSDGDQQELSEDEERPKLPTAKIGKKKAAKLEAKALKKEQRVAEEREREEQRERDALKAEEEQKKEEEEAAEEALRIEEERKAQEERERKEQEEYEKMKAMFSVDEVGFDQDGDEDQEKDRLREFVDFIKHEKVVVLEELAARFRMKTQAAINRVTDLQADGTLTGVLDDRGKFIYISPAELEGVAKFIRQRGRVTLGDLAEASATLISLTPDSPIQA